MGIKLLDKILILLFFFEKKRKLEKSCSIRIDFLLFFLEKKIGKFGKSCSIRINQFLSSNFFPPTFSSFFSKKFFFLIEQLFLIFPLFFCPRKTEAGEVGNISNINIGQNIWKASRPVPIKQILSKFSFFFPLQKQEKQEKQRTFPIL